MVDWATIGISGLVSIAIFVIGQVFAHFFMHPILELKKEIGKVAVALTYHANIYTQPEFVTDESVVLAASNELRLRGSELPEKAKAVPWLAPWITRMPSRKDIHQASGELIGLSNAMYSADKQKIAERRATIERLLKI